eukprot:1586760-Rhodomonas_salina.1
MQDPVMVVKVNKESSAVREGDTVERSALLRIFSDAGDVEFVTNRNIQQAIDDFRCAQIAESTPVDA